MFPEGRIFEFLIVGIVALIVVGPKDLPILMRKVGQFIAHMRGMAAEFRASFEEMARQSELDELRKEVEALRSGQVVKAHLGFEGDADPTTLMQDIRADLNGEVLPQPAQPATAPTPEPATAPAAPL